MLPDLTNPAGKGFAAAGVQFAATLQLSRTSTILARNRSWRHLKRLWVNATLHPDKMCWMLATQGAAHLVSKPLGKVPRACEVVIGCP